MTGGAGYSKAQSEASCLLGKAFDQGATFIFAEYCTFI